ncbi:MAG TPA: NAD(P)-dependent oxidoreductase [Candidatus Acidoferrum sp.]
MTPPGSPKHILVTGATGKVGRNFIDRILRTVPDPGIRVRALCHNRLPEPHSRLEIVQGNISDRAIVCRAMTGITHVVHCATCKETPDDVIDVTVKGLFWLLEECRASPHFQRIILIGGDAAVGHFYYPHPNRVTEQQRHTAYPGCYALSKVLEEVMLEQYFVQYHLRGCCLRAPWIMERDDFKFSLSFGEDVFGGPRWRDLVGPARADEYIQSGAVPVMLDPHGQPVRRNFVHVTDLLDAILLALDHPGALGHVFNISMDEPVDYRQAAEYLRQTRNLPSVDVPTPYWSTWLDNTKAKSLLAWRPHYNLHRLIDEAWSYQRTPTAPRITYYPG